MYRPYFPIPLCWDCVNRAFSCSAKFVVGRVKGAIVLSCLGMVLGGCQAEEELEPLVIPPLPIADEPVVETVPTDPDEPPPPGGEETPGAERLATVDKFVAPFPNRVDIFSPPKRAQSSVRRTTDDEDDTLELIGFVNVDEPRVVLDIDGVTSHVAVGQERYGIRVISIDQPSVTLQRGRITWTATLD